MAGNDDEIRVRLTADPSDLAAGFEAAADVAEESQQRMADAATAAAAQIKTASVTVGETEEQAMARIKLMVANSLQQAEANKTVQQSERALREAQGLRVEATEEQLAALAAMRAAQNAQMVSTEGYFGAEAAATAETTANTVATEANAVAQAGLNEKIASGAAVREYSALVDEALRGRYSQMTGTVATLSNRLGFMSALFSPMGAAIAGVVGALGLFVEAMVKGTEEETKFEQAIQSGGNYLGMTTDQLHEMAQAMATDTISINQANEALLAAANTGRVTSQNLQMVATAALNMSQVTGVSVKKAVEDFSSLEDKPLQAAVKLNEQYHFLTEATYDQIAAFEKAGLTDQAAAVAQEAFANAFSDRVKQMERDTSTLGAAWDYVSTGFSNFWNRMKENLGSNTINQQIKVIDDEIVGLEKTMFSLQSITGMPNPLLQAQIDNLTRERAALELLQKNQQGNAAATGLQQALDQYAIDYAQANAKEEAREEKHEQKLTEIHEQGVSERAAAEREMNQNKSDLDTVTSIQQRQAESDVAIQEKAIQRKLALGEISKSEEIAQLQALEQQKFQLALQDLNDQLALQPKETEEYNKLLLKKEQLLATHNEKMADMENQMVEAQVQRYRDMLAPVNAAVQTSINGIIQGTTNGRKALNNIGMAILDEFIAKGIQMVTEWAVTEAAKTSTTVKANATRTNSDAAAAVNSVIAAKSAAAHNINAYAATAAAAAASSVAVIPIYGWAMAPEVAASTYKETLAYEGAAAAEGGWDEVPGNVLTLLHPQEMVLSAPIAEGARRTFREAAGGGGAAGGGDTHIHIHAMDTSGFDTYFRRNPDMLTRALNRASRSGSTPRRTVR